MTRGAPLPGWRGHEPLGSRATEALNALLAKSPGIVPVLETRPPGSFIARLPTYRPTSNYSQLKPALGDLCADLVQHFGKQLALRYGLAVLADLIRAHDRRWSECGLDLELEPEFVDSFHRILTAVGRGGISELMPNTDAYAKELAICLYRLIPAGGQLIDPGSGVPRRWLIGWPTRERTRFVRYLLTSVKGHAPLAELHTNLFQRRWFTRQGWEHTFRLMPAVFRSYPRLKGILGSSWFLDPSLGKTSPELAFIREITERFGAAPLHLQRVKSLETAAFSLSPTRRQLFESGQYVPNVYALVISKRDIERTLSTGGAT